MPQVNAVVLKNINDDELLDFAEFTRTRDVEVRFIEYMPFDGEHGRSQFFFFCAVVFCFSTAAHARRPCCSPRVYTPSLLGNRWNFDRFVSYQDMLARIQSKLPLARLTDGPNETSKVRRSPRFAKSMVAKLISLVLSPHLLQFQTWQVTGYAGRLGFITSMSDHFCGTCNRVRLTADGNLKVCLFGNSEVSLRDVMRQGADDEALLELIHGALGRKKAQHAGMFTLARQKNRPMILIGG